MTSPATPPATPTRFPELYERHLVGPLFRPWAERLLERVPLAAGARVLDVACGTGIAARLARERVGERGRVVGVDRNAAMLAVARSIEPAIDWREGDAAALPLADDERFDAVLCHQGVQFFPDRAAAARAMHAALAPDGWLAVGVWRSLGENGLFHDLARAAEPFVGPVRDGRHGFTDADALARLLTDAGFADVRVEAMTLETRFETDGAELVRLNANALLGMSEAGKAMADAERAAMAARIAEASLPELERYRDGGAIAFRTSANVATARKA